MDLFIWSVAAIWFGMVIEAALADKGWGMGAVLKKLRHK